jgi:hypothetical protein
MQVKPSKNLLLDKLSREPDGAQQSVGLPAMFQVELPTSRAILRDRICGQADLDKKTMAPCTGKNLGIESTTGWRCVRPEPEHAATLPQR